MWKYVPNKTGEDGKTEWSGKQLFFLFQMNYVIIACMYTNYILPLHVAISTWKYATYNKACSITLYVRSSFKMYGWRHLETVNHALELSLSFTVKHLWSQPRDQHTYLHEFIKLSFVVQQSVNPLISSSYFYVEVGPVWERWKAGWKWCWSVDLLGMWQYHSQQTHISKITSNPSTSYHQRLRKSLIM